MRERYLLLVPVGVMAEMHPEGTAFVGRRLQSGGYLVHYEEPGNASNVVTFEDRIVHAAGRLHEDYPTSKMCGGDDEHFTEVGTVIRNSDLGWHIEHIIDPDALVSWAPGPHYEGGSPDMHEEVRTNHLNSMIRKGLIP